MTTVLLWMCILSIGKSTDSVPFFKHLHLMVNRPGLYDMAFRMVMDDTPCFCIYNDEFGLREPLVLSTSNPNEALASSNVEHGSYKPFV